MSEDEQAEIEPIRWKIKGVGMYGSDVEVVSAGAYDDLKRQYDNLIEGIKRRWDNAHPSEESL